MYLVRNQTKNILITMRRFEWDAEESAITYSRNHPRSLVIVSLPSSPRTAIHQFQGGKRIEKEEEAT